MIGRWSFDGHAIVSADDQIAGADGLTPESLRNEADWSRFQAALDAAAVTILGRLGHEANPNRKGRNRLVLSSSVGGVTRRDDAWWWNPAEAPIEEALDRAAPGGGVAVVPGGRQVFDMFLKMGFDTFHLARAETVTIGQGVPIFSAVSEGRSAVSVLSDHHLVPGPTEILDPVAGVSLTMWHRPVA